ncbi:MAG: glycosyltransferase family 2 protein [Imperialibacter sp.]|uniref:glycosyltransferase family 2 protein n=1 Tax=Imperialibacter sp. TaxID=2038411 RepID=UPI0032EED153
MISFIMPAKNAASYIRESILSLQKEKTVKWELIVVNDSSEDDTYKIVHEVSLKDSRIKIYNNTGTGKVQGLNYGFSLSEGQIIKCIDADDVLLPAFFAKYDDLKNFDAHCHDSFVVDQKLKTIGNYYVNKSIISATYEDVLKYMISIPRWAWSMKREIAEQVFPMPEDLPFEDVWFSFMIKRRAEDILHIKEKLYLYRQHTNQTFGGILNYGKAKVNFRARRMLQLVDCLLKNRERLGMHQSDIFDYSVEYNSLLTGGFKTGNILRSKLKTLHKGKLLLICFFPSAASIVTRIKWKFDDLKH